ncbi:hypothetical protein [Kocuria sp.]|uniref:hypothetical protein n=1 Tax=Kocuria sp. TaxID=1871328 RepID=UPI0026E0E915|nr:hypothetical protein [Kocuria sp.]MDO5619769.1 hypothetical protein [Kocuria sp.]
MSTPTNGSPDPQEPNNAPHPDGTGAPSGQNSQGSDLPRYNPPGYAGQDNAGATRDSSPGTTRRGSPMGINPPVSLKRSKAPRHCGWASPWPWQDRFWV